MAQASLFLVVSVGVVTLGVVTLGVVTLGVVTLVVVTLGDSLSGAATGFSIWLELLHENNDENIVLYCIYRLLDTMRVMFIFYDGTHTVDDVPTENSVF
jgi:hypothetical protein